MGSSQSRTMTETPASRQGRLNRQKGKRKQAAVRRELEVIFESPCIWEQMKRDEETWLHLPIGVEVKAGGQAAPIHTRYKNAREQHYAAIPNDERPFVYVACPDNLADSYVVIRLSDLGRIINGRR